MSETPRLILTVGLAGSGKSTWAIEQQKLTPNTIIVERDKIRETLTGNMRDHTREGAVTRMAQRVAMGAVLEGKDVIVSDTNLKAKYRRVWQKFADQWGAKYEEVSFMHVPIVECIRRDAERDNPVGEEVILRMWESWCQGNK